MSNIIDMRLDELLQQHDLADELVPACRVITGAYLLLHAFVGSLGGKSIFATSLKGAQCRLLVKKLKGSGGKQYIPSWRPVGGKLGVAINGVPNSFRGCILSFA